MFYKTNNLCGLKILRLSMWLPRLFKIKESRSFYIGYELRDINSSQGRIIFNIEWFGFKVK
jgi:hypothetical protein